MIKTKNKVAASAGSKGKKKIISNVSANNRAANREVHAHLQKVYQDNGFIGSSDRNRIDFPVSRYRNHPGLIAAVIILVIALVGALAYICVPFAASWSKSATTTTAEETEQQQPAADTAAADQPTNSPAAETPAAAQPTPADQLANWLTYQDNSGVFEFKYAPTWQADQQDPQIVNFTLTEATDTVISANWQAAGNNLNAYLLALDKTNAKAYEGKPSVQIERQGNVQIGSLPAFQRWQKLLAADLEQIVTYIPIGNKIYALSVRSPKLDDQVIQAYGLFLSTFKVNGTSSAPATTVAPTTPNIK